MEISLFISLLISLLTLLCGVLLFPLFGYRKTLMSTMDFFEDWTLNPEKNLPLPSGNKHQLIHLITQGIEMRMNFKRVEIELNSEKEVSRITRQLAHDILSPTMALNMAVQGGDNLPPSRLNLITSSLQRIVQISQSLTENKENNQEKMENRKNHQEKIDSLPVTPLIQDMIKKKETKDIEFIVETPKDVEIICFPLVFKKSLSNTIDNCMKAIHRGGWGTGVIFCQALVENNVCKITLTCQTKRGPSKIFSLAPEKKTHLKTDIVGIFPIQKNEGI